MSKTYWTGGKVGAGTALTVRADGAIAIGDNCIHDRMIIMAHETDDVLAFLNTAVAAARAARTTGDYASEPPYIPGFPYKE